MRNLYKHLQISPEASDSVIRGAINNCTDSSIKKDATHILLNPNLKAVYDRNYHLLKVISEIRGELKLDSTPNWFPILRDEFRPPVKQKSYTFAWTLTAIGAFIFACIMYYCSNGQAAKREWKEIEENLSYYESKIMPRSSAQKDVILSLKEVSNKYPSTTHGRKAAAKLTNIQSRFLANIANSKEADHVYNLFPTREAGNGIAEVLLKTGKNSNDPKEIDQITVFLRGAKFQGLTETKKNRINTALNDRKEWLVDSIQREAYTQAANKNSEDDLVKFIETYPNSVYRLKAEADLKELLKRYSDFSFVQQVNTIRAYQRFLKLNPSSRFSGAAKKRIIDLEVDEILSGDVGQLPEMSPLNQSNSRNRADVKVTNDTSYTLIVRYSGTESQKHSIPPKGSKSFTILKGQYRVAASVKRGGVRSYAGNENIYYDRYSSSFYIVSY